MRLILQRELKREIPATYHIAPFEESLTKGGFTILARKMLKDVHSYALEEYLVLLQSYSIWNHVPTIQRKRMLQVLKKHFATKLEKGLIHDTRDVEVLIAEVKR